MNPGIPLEGMDMVEKGYMAFFGTWEYSPIAVFWFSFCTS